MGENPGCMDVTTTMLTLDRILRCFGEMSNLLIGLPIFPKIVLFNRFVGYFRKGHGKSEFFNLMPQNITFS